MTFAFVVNFELFLIKYGLNMSVDRKICNQKFFFGNGPYFSVIEHPSFGFGRRLHLS